MKSDFSRLWRRPLLAFLGGILLAASAGAKPIKCAEYLTPKTKLSVNSLNEGREFDRVAKVIAWADHGPLSKLRHPPQTRFYLEAGPIDPSFFDFELVIKRSATLDPRDAEVVDAHEYTHAVFSENMKSLSPAWAAMVEEWQRYFNEVKPRRLELTDALGNNDSQQIDLSQKAKTDPRAAALLFKVQKENEVLRAQLSRMTPPDASQVPLILPISRPYQEVIADLVGSLRAGGFSNYVECLRRVIHHSVPFPWNSQELEKKAGDMQFRSFSTPVLVEGWNNSELSRDTHHMFDPVRHYLYVNYLSKPGCMDHIENFIQGLFAVMSREVIERSQDPKDRLLSSELVNRLMIERLRAELPITVCE